MLERCLLPDIAEDSLLLSTIAELHSPRTQDAAQQLNS
jgi:hypothetical protein